MLPSYGSSWPGEGASEPHAPLWRRLARWLPPLLLALLSLCCFAAVLLLALLPTIAIAAPLGEEVRTLPPPATHPSQCYPLPPHPSHSTAAFSTTHRQHLPADDAGCLRWPRVGSAGGLPPRVLAGRGVVREGGAARSRGDPALAVLARARRPGLLPQRAAGGREEGRQLAALLHKVRRVQARPNASLRTTRAVRPRAAALERLVQQRRRLLQLQVLSTRPPLCRPRARRMRGHVAPRRRAEHPRRAGGGRDASRIGGPAARRARQRAGIAAAQPA